MKFVQILFIMVAYGIVKTFMIVGMASGTDVEFPTLTVPDFDLKDLSAGCGGFTDCIEYAGNVVFNIGAGFIAIITFTFSLLIFMVELIGLVISSSASGFDDAPAWVNTMSVMPFLAGFAVIIFKIFRSGSSED